MILDCRNDGKCETCKYNLLIMYDFDAKLMYELDESKIYNWCDKHRWKDNSKRDFIYTMMRQNRLLSCCEIDKGGYDE